VAERFPNCPERQLWAEVVRLARTDMVAGGDLAYRVRRWLVSPDFEKVCDLADIDHSAAARFILRGNRRGQYQSRAA
jgi:hypothetical protein